MQALLDTHTFLWFIMDDDRLSHEAHTIISTTQNRILLSMASLWEIAIKTSIGRLPLTRSFAELFPAQLHINQIELLSIDIDALEVIARLPFHHRDPFDRLLIAQAITEQLPIVTRDMAFSAYPVEVIW